MQKKKKKNDDRKKNVQMYVTNPDIVKLLLKSKTEPSF